VSEEPVSDKSQSVDRVWALAQTTCTNLHFVPFPEKRLADPRFLCRAIELAETISTSFQNNAADGLLGLAWVSCAVTSTCQISKLMVRMQGSINTVTPTRVRTPVENMVAQSAIATYAELFTAYLGSYKDASDPDRGQSFYTFGYIDKDVVKSTGSDVYYAPVDNSNGFWQFPSSSYTINGTVTKTAGRTAIADTGTSLALVDDATCKAIYDAIPGSKLSKEFGVSNSVVLRDEYDWLTTTGLHIP